MVPRCASAAAPSRERVRANLAVVPDVHHLAPDDRPREKLGRHGASVLGDNELLAILIGHGQPGRDALAVANDVLELAGGVHGLTRLGRDRLVSAPGVGPAQAARVLAAVELGRRTLTVPRRLRPRFQSARDAAAYLLPLYGAYPVERFGVMLLDTRYRLLSVRLISIGSLDASTAHPREVFREALVAGAATVVVFHNHPSGDPTPSQDDMDLTKRMAQAGKVVGVEMADHLVLADDKYASLRAMGLF
jgi:DNA repair protein RadC